MSSSPMWRTSGPSKEQTGSAGHRRRRRWSARGGVRGLQLHVGDLVPLAPVGSVLPGGFAIGRRKMKGVTSNGMLCSGAELRLSNDQDGILVIGKTAGASRPTPGTPVMEVLGLARDVVFDITVEVNRPDASSIRGVARDLAARLELAVRRSAGTAERAEPMAERSPPVAGPPVEELATVRVEDPDLCPRFVARVLTGVPFRESPAWIARRLTLAGMRPINNVVDASNYVMLELGQPTHPYDLDRLDGDGLIVRRAASRRANHHPGRHRAGRRPSQPGPRRRYR